ncbi:MAG: DUF1499 domain-containing protein [Alphaproteobacteria bacterium]|nr:DUF1499 domain-containing protein [Alphaproteobacteria bacterium]MBU2270947.1 DUF1499 domain-containing protein [Alphaproteobacteria bacterium]MBU2417122.1 DUF1499 domain-containing protein [Alphaproteobacteria bacterium]
MARLKRASTGGGSRLAALVVLAPVFVLIAALGTRTGLWTYAIGHDLLAMRVGIGLAAIGAIAAVMLLVFALRGRASPWLAAVAITISALTVGGYAWQASRLTSAPPDDISTDLAEVPGFGDLAARRGGAGPAATGGPEACPGAAPVMTQVAPAAAVWALQESGFSVQGRVNVGRAAGTHRGFWFGSAHDAAVRIRPGRTDVRVAARDGRSHGGEACRLATRLSERLRVVE